MKRVFKVLADDWGSLTGRTVLDLGCGRGRWSKEYAVRGARVTGVDISPDAISLLAEEMPQHQFICQDIPALSFPWESFDVVSSVTVMQHMPQEKQEFAFSLSAQWIKPGGYLVLLENVMGFDAPHVFPHRTAEWIRMVEATGLKRTACWGSNFEVLFRVEARIMRQLRGNNSSRDGMIPKAPYNGQSSLESRLKSGAKAALAGLSFPMEWVCQRVPLATPTHSVMIFRK
jgi:SAM-dependent methyltransferase